MHVFGLVEEPGVHGKKLKRRKNMLASALDIMPTNLTKCLMHMATKLEMLFRVLVGFLPRFWDTCASCVFSTHSSSTKLNFVLSKKFHDIIGA